MSTTKAHTHTCTPNVRQRHKTRKQIRRWLAIAATIVIAGPVGFNALKAWWHAEPLIGHVVFLVFGLGLTSGLWWFFESRDPDPDPAAAQRESEQARVDRANAAKIKATEKAARLQQLEAARSQQQALTAEKREKQAADAKIRNEAAAELAAGIMIQHLQQQTQAQRSNRVLELLLMFESNPSKAIRLASQEGIDLHAEAIARSQAGAGAIGLAIGAGLQAGSEIVKRLAKRNT